MGDLKRPFKKGRGTTNFIKAVLPFAAGPIGGVLGGALGISAGLGTAMAAGGIASITGGDPLKAALFSGIASTLNNLPKTNPIRQFFSTSAGQGVLSAFVQAGGSTSEFQGFLDNLASSLGISGGTRDMINDALLLTALIGISKKYAEPAKKRMEEIETKQLSAINEMMLKVKALYPDKQTYEADVQKGMEAVDREYNRVLQATTHGLAERGLGEQVGAQLPRIEESKGLARLQSRRDIEEAQRKEYFDRTAQAIQTEGQIAQLYNPILEARRETYENELGVVPGIAETVYGRAEGRDYNKLLEQQLMTQNAILQKQLDALNRGESVDMLGDLGLTYQPEPTPTIPTIPTRTPVPGFPEGAPWDYTDIGIPNAGQIGGPIIEFPQRTSLRTTDVAPTSSMAAFVTAPGNRALVNPIRRRKPLPVITRY